ncbi:MAG: CRISPR-associated helicase Cas3', partial [Promethearchaeia archaeon]
MGNGSLSFELKSHQDKLLFEHIKEVKEHANKLIKNNEFDVENEDLKKLIKIITISHDFGKSSEYFQKKLNDKLNSKEKLSEHSLISALFGYYLIKQEELNTLDDEFAKAAVFNIIAHHHGNLENLEKSLDIERKKYLLEIWDSILKNRAEVEKIYQKILNKNINLNKFDNFLRNKVFKKKKLHIVSPLLERRAMSDEKVDYFFKFNLIYSILLESDKKSASGAEKRKSGFKPSENMLKKYKSRFNYKKEFNKVREKIYKETISELEDSWQKKKFFEIDAPTGSGKTLTLLGSAFKLSEKIREKRGIKPKIIYSLPFISIIEQNYNVFRDVIENSIKSVTDEILLEHHHLADEVFEAKKEKMDYSKSSFLIENWYSDIVVTTFYQLFKSIYTNKNHLLKKYNKITNSIILIDEIQAIPPNLLESVRDCLKYFSEKFNSYIILGTATQPQLNAENESEEDKLKSLKLFSISESDKINKNEIDNFFNRYYLDTSLLRQEMTIDDLAKVLKKDTNLSNIMIVLNTINSTKKLYRKLDENPIFKDYEKIYLSTNIPPKERAERIKKAKKNIENNEKFLLITTQLIEAGVDISVEKIYRDMAPLDKIVQTAGRTNRNNEKNFSKVNVLNLIDENNKNIPYSSYV